MTPQRHVLLVEDDSDLAFGLTDALHFNHYIVTSAGDGETGLREALAKTHDVVILDIMLPRKSGLDVLRELRSRGYTTPVLMLTARTQEIDKVRGLKLGADDYVTKPFGMAELMARLEALIRRSQLPIQKQRRLEVGEIIVDFEARTASKRQRDLRLTPREFDILSLLTARPGLAISRSELIARLWGSEDSVEVTTRTIDQHVAAIRRKFDDDPEEPKLIQTVYGFGYRWAG